jgi:7,8-dihydro-6-hydroxymethylpterin-pyrophosphokinase
MEQMIHQTLVHVSADLVGGTAVAQGLIEDMKRVGQIQALSSVYKRFANAHKTDLQASLETVLYFRTNCAVDELLWYFRSYTKERRAQLTLLSYDDLVVLSPQLTLPHPSLHTDHLMVRCASEALPSYEHPIIQKRLTEIAGQGLTLVNAEFFLQGKSLVDFQRDET